MLQNNYFVTLNIFSLKHIEKFILFLQQVHPYDWVACWTTNNLEVKIFMNDFFTVIISKTVGELWPALQLGFSRALWLSRSNSLVLFFFRHVVCLESLSFVSIPFDFLAFPTSLWSCVCVFPLCVIMYALYLVVFSQVWVYTISFILTVSCSPCVFSFASR